MNANLREEMSTPTDSSQFESPPFRTRHIAPQRAEVEAMLSAVGARSLEELVTQTVPNSIRFNRALALPPASPEHVALDELRGILSRNEVFRSYIGMGYSGTITPTIIQRNILENPGWYTQYTPYQAEISQGRMEALLNFQTMIADLTALPMSNASLLDEGTAAAEGMMLALRVRGNPGKMRFFISDRCHPHVLDVVNTRAEALGVETVIGAHDRQKLDESFFGALVQYPATDGEVIDYRPFTEAVHKFDGLVIAACDLLSLVLLTPPGEWGADVAVGNSQRFGVPMGFGGPHAAFFATRDEFKREIPGRVIGVSKDSRGKPAYRLALQTREQHIRRERATSNICTAQVLLAVMASMYAVYHGPDGLTRIARRIRRLTEALRISLKNAGIKTGDGLVFDTLRCSVPAADAVLSRSEKAKVNLRRYDDGSFGVSLCELTTPDDVATVLAVLTGTSVAECRAQIDVSLGAFSEPKHTPLDRSTDFLTHPVFHRYRAEHEMLRYIFRLQGKDLSLVASMIPLGSCTMKLNATSEMLPVTWPEVAHIHPFAPDTQTVGYRQMISQLESWLAEITGLAGISLQPNAGSQGEYAGLLAIRAYHRSRGDAGRKVCLIPTSAHGTNPASAAMAALNVVTVACDDRGNVDLSDLAKKAEEHRDSLACLMITYPSTHGVFEESIREICDVVHKHGGLVYMDGANLNAQVGLCRPGDFGVDVCHLNLHKTFCIPHGGGGPGVGPVCVAERLRAFLPGMPSGLSAAPQFGSGSGGTESPVGPVSSAPWGSAAILVISWMYIRMMGADGLREATQTAILNANYIASRLEPHFPVLYRGSKGRVAHECILDLRHLKRTVGIEVADVAKRLMDYGFHAPTVSFPVAETLMVEPTESESLAELDRFCDAMIAIRGEIREIEEGRSDRTDNPLKNAPHTADVVASSTWSHPYSRETAAFPAQGQHDFKFWPAVGRVDNAWGDRNLFCTCVPLGAEE